MSTPHTFRFHVARVPGADLWTVYLPHQCDAWDIWDITDPDCDGYGYGGADYVPYQVAMERLELFIAEAEGALAALRQRLEQDPDA